MNELRSGIPSLLLLLGTSEYNTQYMLVFIDVTCLSNNGSVRLLNEKMAELIGKLNLMDTCDMKKHGTVGHKLQKMFIYIGTKKMSSTNNPGDTGLPKRINFLGSLESDFKNTILKMAIHTLGKGQNQYSVATILRTANIYDA